MGRTLALAAMCLAVAAFHRAVAPDTFREVAAEKPAAVKYRNAEPGVEYVGDQVCGSCHAVQYKNFKQTAMGRSASVPSAEDLASLSKPVNFSSQTLNRSYSVYARNGKMVHEESERDAEGQPVFSETHEIAYTIGAGEVGKSYLVAKGDTFYVSPISYYTRINGWDLSPGYDRSLFRDFTRPVAELCVDCHTGQPRFVVGKPDHFQQPPFRFLGVSCERCHGPGALHVKERKAGAALNGPIDLAIVNPARVPGEIRDDICAQCHFLGDARVLRPGKNYLDFRPGTPLDKVAAVFSVPVKVKGNGAFALSQFEQLKLSRCAMASQGRLHCITCHDPHVQLSGEKAAADFRGRCLTCHTEESCQAQVTKRQATIRPTTA